MTPLHHRKTMRLRKATRMVAVPLLCLLFVATVRGQSALDGFDPNANGPVRVVAIQPDGKILIGGEFTSLSPNGGASVARAYMARLNPDGTLDAAFNPNPTAPVYAIAVQSDGKILVGGSFAGPNGIGGQPRNNIARLDPATGLADSFNPNANGFIVTIAVQADGKILAGGLFSSIGGQARHNIVRLDPTTGLADSFDPNANSLVRTIVVQADGRILVGGFFSGPNSIGGQTRNYLARLHASTGLADSSGPSANNYVYAIAVQADGRIFAGGNFSNIGGQIRNYVARLDPTTGLADSFDPNANSTVYSLVVQPDGQVLASGAFTQIGGQMRNRIARLIGTGLADSFDPNANGAIEGIAVQPDGKVLAAGYFNGANSIRGQTRNYIARLEKDGRLDQTLSDVGISGGDQVYALAAQPDGKIVIGGQFTSVLGVARNNLARLNADGTLDLTFDHNADISVVSIAVQADGKIVVGGGFTHIGGQARNRIARLDGVTGLADSFDPNANSTVFSIAVQPDGKILAGGLFNGPNSIGGQTRNRIARLDPTTGLADSFDPNANNTVYSIALQVDGKILAGGWFNGPNSIGGQARNRIARLDPTTGLADSFDPNADNWVYAVVVQSDGKILLGGDFRTMGGQTRNCIARLDPATGLVDLFNPNSSWGINSIAIQADGKVLVGGRFAGSVAIGGLSRNRIARLDATTGLPDSFNPNADREVYSILVLPDGKILTGGLFTNIGGQTRNYFARLSNDTSSRQDLAVTQTTVNWTRGGSGPQLARVTFEYSVDNLIYTVLGNGALDGNSWGLSGLSLPTGQNIYIRARGYYRGGLFGNSESLTESVRNVFLDGPAPTPPPSPSPTATSVPTATATATPTATTTPVPSATATGTATVAPSATPSATPTATATATPTATIAATPTPSPSLTPIPTPTITATPAPTLTPIPSPKPATQAVNLSTRMHVQTGDSVGIGGFIVTGTASKHVVLRAIGPSLTQVGVPDVLGDPVLELHGPTGFVTIVNDNWRDNQPNTIAASGLAPTNDLEAAIDATLAPGAYTAILRGKDNTSGVALMEVYDLNQSVAAKLANISTRALVGTGNDVVIAGFILGGGAGNDRLVLRGIGPSLAAVGVANALANPNLELRDSDGALVAANNDWQDDPAQAAELTASGLAPANNLESGLAMTLPPGLYTALFSGVNNSTGIGLVEVYDRGP